MVVSAVKWKGKKANLSEPQEDFSNRSVPVCINALIEQSNNNLTHIFKQKEIKHLRFYPSQNIPLMAFLFLHIPSLICLISLS